MHNFNHLNEADPLAEQVEYANEAYTKLVNEVSRAMPPHHAITYVPLTEAQVSDGAEHLQYADTTKLPEIMRDADLVICISRDSVEPKDVLTPNYTEQYPHYNTTLTPSGRSNVDTAVDLFTMAREQGDDTIRFIATGRMHNQAIRAMLALPVVAVHLGLNAEDLYRVPQAKFRQLLEVGFSRKNIANLELDPEDPEVGASHKALIKLLKNVPTVKSSDEELAEAVEAVWQEYQAYPRISTSRLMVERAVHRGVPLEAIYEEDGAVDTITNLLNTTKMLVANQDFEDTKVHKVVIVAGSDHLPRTMWIADHILPDGIEIVCVESDPALSQDAYDASCERELGSFRKGSDWIGRTRDLDELTAITEKGYFGINRKTADEIARDVKNA